MQEAINRSGKSQPSRLFLDPYHVEDGVRAELPCSVLLRHLSYLEAMPATEFLDIELR